MSVQYVLVKNHGIEGHDPPTVLMGIDDARIFLLTHEGSFDTTLTLYWVPDIYDLKKDPSLRTRRIELAELCPPKAEVAS